MPPVQYPDPFFAPLNNALALGREAALVGYQRRQGDERQNMMRRGLELEGERNAMQRERQLFEIGSARDEQRDKLSKRDRATVSLISERMLKADRRMLPAIWGIVTQKFPEAAKLLGEYPGTQRAVEMLTALSLGQPERRFNAAELGGATGQLIDRYLQENPGATWNEAFYAVGGRGAARDQYMTPEGAVAAIPGAPQARGELRRYEKGGEQEAIEDYAAKIEAEKVRGRTEAEGEAALPKARERVVSKLDEVEDVFDAINLARNQANRFGATGITGALTDWFPTSPGANLNATVATIKSKLSLDALQEMRRTSPTGGALGNVSNAEGERLERNVANLENSQTKEQFLVNLATVERNYRRMIVRMKDAYDRDVKRFGKDKVPPLPWEQMTEGGPLSGPPAGLGESPGPGWVGVITPDGEYGWIPKDKWPQARDKHNFRRAE